jgi:hypothetical protein
MKADKVIVIHHPDISAYQAREMITSGYGVDYMPPQDFVDFLFRKHTTNEEAGKQKSN